jgi:type VI secretion system secreted protein Hcp
MALNAYLRLTGETQGEIKGSVTQYGREDSILIIASNHEIVSPRDAASGLPTGKRQHKPITIIKEVDQSSPLLYQALVNNENFPEWELQFWRAGIRRRQTQFYTVQLVNAQITAIHFELPNTRYPETARLNEFEQVSFVYQRIRWTWEDGGITAEDDWETPVV